MRGEGINITQKYKWIKQPNDKYTIFDVPIFQTFKKGQFSASIKDLQQSILKFEDRKEGGYYPSIHLQHQELEDNSECQNVGFLDNIHIKDDGLMYADLAELDEETLKDIKNLKRPYRSVEYDPIKNDVVSLALMTSKPPYNKYSMLAVEDEPLEMGGEYMNFSEKREVLQFLERRNRIIGDDRMKPEDTEQFEDEETEEAAEDEEMEDEGEEPEMETEEEQEEEDFSIKHCKDVLDQVVAQSQKNGQLLEALVDALNSDEDDEDEDYEDEDEDMEDEDEDEEDDEKLNSETPSSVAMGDRSMRKNGANAQLKAMNKLLVQMSQYQKKQDKEIAQMKETRSTNQFSAQLKAICQENPNIDYSSHNTMLMQFSGTKNKKLYLKQVKNTGLQFSSDTPGRLLAGVPKNLKNRKNVLLRFSNRSQLVQNTARQAGVDYKATCNQMNTESAAKFKRTWPTENSYIQAKVNLCEIDD